MAAEIVFLWTLNRSLLVDDRPAHKSVSFQHTANGSVDNQQRRTIEAAYATAMQDAPL